MSQLPWSERLNGLKQKQHWPISEHWPTDKSASYMDSSFWNGTQPSYLQSYRWKWFTITMLTKWTNVFNFTVFSLCVILGCIIYVVFLKLWIISLRPLPVSDASFSHDQSVSQRSEELGNHSDGRSSISKPSLECGVIVAACSVFAQHAPSLSLSLHFLPLCWLFQVFPSDILLLQVLVIFSVLGMHCRVDVDR